jgi:hypothetical protein
MSPPVGTPQFAEAPDAIGFKMPCGIVQIACVLRPQRLDFHALRQHEIAQNSDAELARAPQFETGVPASAFQGANVVPWTRPTDQDPIPDDRFADSHAVIDAYEADFLPVLLQPEGDVVHSRQPSGEVRAGRVRLSEPLMGH